MIYKPVSKAISPLPGKEDQQSVEGQDSEEGGRIFQSIGQENDQQKRKDTSEASLHLILSRIFQINARMEANSTST